MNGPIDAILRRKQLEQFAGLLAEKRRRAAKVEHQTRGYRDEGGVWRCGLLSFVKYFWHILEPGTPFVDGWPLEAICEHLEAVTFGEITKLLINVPPGFMKSMLTDVFWPAWEWSAQNMAHLRYVTFSYSASITERDNAKFRDLITHPDFQALYKAEVVVRKTGETKITNAKHGWKLASSVGGVGTGERGDRIILDDPHNVKESESEQVRTETVRWFRESMSSRLNDIQKGAIVIIMQRVHEDDVSGTILEHEFPYVHLLIAMRYVWDADEDGEPYATEIGWVDPRWTEDPDECEDELAWPERFPEHSVVELEAVLGPYACTPAESPVLMADLTYKPISDVRPGDAVVGFTIDTHGGTRRKHTVPTNVRAIHRYRADVVKLTFASGTTARCTPDHKWYMGKQAGNSGFVRKDGSRSIKPLYRPAKIGRKLMRVSNLDDATCPPGYERDAGWLAGFFDGDGSVSNCGKAGTKFKPSASIVFYQGNGRNGPNCRELERCLTRFGFEWAMSSDKRKTKGTNFDYCAYRLLGNDLPLYQRFLNVISPVKWRDRILQAAFGTKFIIAQEEVVSIEPDGHEDVFALETETGNYVVWGLASSNSAGQLQQTPEARGGGIIKREFWQNHAGKFPAFSYVFASLDGAFTEDETNDPSALSVWGVFENAEGHNRAMLIFAWRKFLQFEGTRLRPEAGENQRDFMARQMKEWGLIEWTAHTCKYWKVDRLLIEAKASGISAAQSLQKRYQSKNWSVQLTGVKGDKVSRAIAVQPTLSNKMVYAPLEKDWCRMVIDEAAVFPNGKHDDLTDTVTQALKHLRDLGLLEFDEDIRAEELRNARLPEKDNKLKNYMPGT